MPAVTAYTALWKRAISRTQFSPLIFPEHLPYRTSFYLGRSCASTLSIFCSIYPRIHLSPSPSIFLPHAFSLRCQDAKRNRNNPIARCQAKKFPVTFEATLFVAEHVVEKQIRRTFVGGRVQRWIRERRMAKEA